MSDDFESYVDDNVVHFSSYNNHDLLLDEVLPEKYPKASELCFYSVAGEIAKKACARSEADEIAVLFTLLVWFSAYIQCEAEVGGIRHPSRIFVALWFFPWVSFLYKSVRYGYFQK